MFRQLIGGKELDLNQIEYKGVHWMSTDVKIFWLKRVLVIKAFFTVFIWGLPALLGPQSLLEFVRVPIPPDPIYLRLFGGAATAWGVVYWLAHKDPMRNVAIVKPG